MLDTSTIHDLMTDLLASMTTYLESASPGPGLTMPTRAYVTAGQVADDEEQFVIAANRIYFGSVESENLRDQKLPNFPRTVVLEIRFAMCAPPIPNNAAAPSAEALNTNAASVLEWAVAIGNALITAYKEGVFNRCAGVAIGPSVPIGPEGQYTGISQELRVGL